MIARAPKKSERPPYVPRGAAWGALHSHAPAVLLSGPAGTGKSLACLMKLHLCASCNPGFRGLLCRRTRKSLTDTGLVTFERDVLPPAHEARGKVKRDGRHSYPYANGSEVVVGGLDNVASIMSSDYDLVVVLEATEASQDAVEMLSTRLRNGKMGYQQLLMDCNPDRPGHWLYQRSGPPGSGKAVLRLESRHEDNPVLWDAARGDWTAEGRRYVLGVLEGLTGPRKLRLRHGRWVQAEGIVYESWDPAVHLIDRFEVPHNWPRYWSVDFGYTNPFACVMAALDGDGRLYVYRQIYHTKRLVTQHAERMKQLTLRDGRPAGIVADPEDREGRETLASLGFDSVAAVKQGGAMGAGIQAVQARLKRAGDGRPRLYVLRDSLDERDGDLAAARLPTCLEDEIDGYVWSNKGRDEPAPNQADHACFVAGTLVTTGAGERPIEGVRPGEMVLTRAGFRKVLAAGMTDASAAVQTLLFGDGRTLTCTPDHPVYLPAATDFVRADALRYGDSLLDVRENPLWKSSTCPASDPESSACASTASSIAAILIPAPPAAGTISAVASLTSGAASAHSTVTCGRTTTAPSQRATRSTTLTKILLTITSTISNACRRLNTASATSRPRDSARRSPTSRPTPASGSGCNAPPASGTSPTRGARGTANTAGSLTPSGNLGSTPVSIAAEPTRRRRSAERSSVLSIAGPPRGGNAATTTSSASAPAAGLASSSTVTPAPGIVRSLAARGSASRRRSASSVTPSSPRLLGDPGATASPRVLTRIAHGSRCPVFNLTVEGEHEYYANGVLVSNCDALRYLCFALDAPRAVREDEGVTVCVT